MRQFVRGLHFAVWTIAGAAVIVVVVGLYSHLRGSNYKLPYHDSFVNRHADEWKAFGGTWELVDGTMRNSSDERGAKLLTGSRYWHNYSVDANVMLLGQNGDAGLIIRSSDEEDGVDAYTGYYAGLRDHDSSLILGRAQHEWLAQKRQVTLGGAGIRPLQWYHLRLLAYNCDLIAAASLPGSTEVAALALRDPNCISTGRIGLRSYSSGGAWKNVTVRFATQADADAMLAEAAKSAQATLKQTPDLSAEAGDSPIPPWSSGAREGPFREAIQPIGDLRSFSYSDGTRATVRGTVILTSPTIFLQDLTGGIELLNPKGSPLKIGDEVEATGDVHPGDFHSTMNHANVRILWSHTPTPPVGITAAQAATGAFDSNFVELDGRLVSKEEGPNDTYVFQLESGSEAFRAIAQRSRAKDIFQNSKLDSLIQLRGVCVVDPAYTQYLTPFVILLRSSDDFTVTAAPPWWSRTHIIAVAAGLLILAVGLNVLYSRAERWKLKAVFKERERLAEEMHDTLAQSFAGIGFQIQAVRNGTPEELQNLHHQLDVATALVRHSHEEARRSIAALRPESLELGDLIAALTFCAEQLVQGGSVRIETSCTGDIYTLPIHVLDTLYRIGQEALANAVAHAQATTIILSLEYRPRYVHLMICDNGIGFSQSDTVRGFGLGGMRKRALSISASLTITSDPGTGTRLEVGVPLPTVNSSFWRPSPAVELDRGA